MSKPLVVSQEFFSPSKILDNLPSFRDDLRNFFQDREETQNIIGSNRVPNVRGMVRRIQKMSYADLRVIPVQVPPGLQCNYLTYLSALDDAVAINEGLMDNVLGPFARWLAIGLSDPDTLRSLGSGRRIQDFKPHNVDGVSLALGKCFKTGSGVHVRKFGDAFERIADVKEVYESADDLAGRFLKTDRKAVQQKVEEISALLDTLIERMTEDDSEYKPSTVTRDLIAKMSYTLAQEVEFYATVGYQLTSLTVALKETEEMVKRAI